MADGYDPHKGIGTPLGGYAGGRPPRDRRGGRKHLLRRLALLLTVLAGGVAALALEPSAAAARPACVWDGPSLSLQSGETVEIPVGKAVRVVLGEGIAYTEISPRFPWTEPRSSNRRVVRHAPLCPHRLEGQTLPIRSAAFRAVRPGRVEISAPLTASWKAVPGEAYERFGSVYPLEPLEEFRATVIVLPRRRAQ